MPSDISDDETTRSMITNGMKTMKPMIIAERSSDRTNAGIERAPGSTSAGFGRVRQVAGAQHQRDLLRSGVREHERLSGATPSCNAACWVFVPCRYGWMPSLVDLGQHRTHDEQAEEQRQSGEHLVRRHRLQAERVTGQRQHHEDLGEAGDQQQQRRRDRHDGDQQQDRHRLARLAPPTSTETLPSLGAVGASAPAGAVGAVTPALAVEVAVEVALTVELAVAVGVGVAALACDAVIRPISAANRTAARTNNARRRRPGARSGAERELDTGIVQRRTVRSRTASTAWVQVASDRAEPSRPLIRAGLGAGFAAGFVAGFVAGNAIGSGTTAGSAAETGTARSPSPKAI